MVWDTITGAGTTTATKFFGDVMNKINDMLNGVDVSDTVQIHANVIWQFRGSSLTVSDTSDTHQYTIFPSELTASRNIILPAILANDTFNTIGLAQTITAVKTHTEDIFFNTQTKGIVNLEFNLVDDCTCTAATAPEITDSLIP